MQNRFRVVDLVNDGKTNKEIGIIIGITTKTVERHKRTAKRLGLLD